MVGYTPDLVVATWLGYDKTNEIYNLNNAGKTMANLYSAEMGALLSISPQTEFAVAAAEETYDSGIINGLKNGLDEFMNDMGSFGQSLGEGSKKLFDWANEAFGQ